MKENFKKKVLSNGFTILFEKRDVPVVSVSISTRCGGINEDLKEKGISHFIEHMLYKGTSKRSSLDISREIEKSGGELNGLTAEEVTSFWCRMPARYIDLALDVLSDMIKNPKFDVSEFEKERQVIFEEIKMRRDSPRHYVMDKIQGALYSGTLGADLIGNSETMNSLSRDDLLQRWKETYSSNNLILCVVGNCEFETLVDWADKNFSDVSDNKIPKYEFSLKTESSTEERKGIDQANMIMAYHSPMPGDDRVYAADLLATLMGGGLSSRLFTEIREKRNLAYSIHADLDVNRDFSHSLIFVGTMPENVSKVKDLILEEYKKVAESLTEEELNEVRQQVIGNYHISMEDSQGQMVHLLVEELIGNAEEFYEYEKKIMDVKLNDVRDLAAQVKEGNYSFFALVPEQKNSE